MKRGHIHGLYERIGLRADALKILVSFKQDILRPCGYDWLSPVAGNYHLLGLS